MPNSVFLIRDAPSCTDYRADSKDSEDLPNHSEWFGTLEPLETWLLVRIEENSMQRLSDLSRGYNIEQTRLQAALERLTCRELVQAAPADGGAQRYKISAAGCSVFNSLIKARRDHLAEMSSDWSTRNGKK
jgi:hypothetical protein